MVDDKTKQKFLKELEKSGNVYLSCLKVGIGRSTLYRWKETDVDFKKLADKSTYRGRENICDIAEHALLLNVKEKKMDAIKYVLSHNSQRYQQKQTSNVVILHKTTSKDTDKQQPHMEDLLELADKIFKDNNEIETERVKGKYLKMEIPTKADGTIIREDELLNYETYIDEWYKKKKIDEAKRVKESEPITPI